MIKNNREVANALAFVVDYSRTSYLGSGHLLEESDEVLSEWYELYDFDRKSLEHAVEAFQAAVLSENRSMSGR